MSTDVARLVLTLWQRSSATRGTLFALFFSTHLSWIQPLQAAQAPRPPQAAYTQRAAETSASPQNDLTEVSIESLMNMEVTSASKKEQKLSQVAAAIFVITQEDIRRSGARNIPDLLRMVPGLDVAQIDANTWAISARGFNLQFANKLLVVIDGRAVYTPLFGGVNWDTLDEPLEDIDRIEVIRGSGGTLWGANAVDGVISIMTKKAEETQGGIVSGGGGTVAQGFGTMQYGGKIEKSISYRIFAKYLNEDHFPDPNGQNGEDGWHLLHGGLRSDANLSSNDKLTVRGDLYTGSEGAIIVHSNLSPPSNLNEQRSAALSGGNVLGRWNHVFSGNSDATLQLYFDQYHRNGPESKEVRDTIDLDFQDHLVLGARQDLIWGLGYRHTGDQTLGTIDQAFVPTDLSGNLFDSFAQDQIALRPSRFYLYVGTKIENSYFSGFDFEPSARLAWTPESRRTFWAAISRATRTATRRDIGLDAVLAALPGPAEVVRLGNPNFKSEHVIEYELGYRSQPVERVSIDVAAFVNVYTDLESIESRPSVVQPNSVPPLLVHPQTAANKLHGYTDGVEAYANWRVTKRWMLSPGYSFLQMRLSKDATSQDAVSIMDVQGSSPTHQAQIRSRLELSRELTWDANLFFVDRLPAAALPAYTRLDTQLTWRVADALSLSVVGQNMAQDHHFEFNDYQQSVNSSQMKRSVYAKITWRF